MAEAPGRKCFFRLIALFLALMFCLSAALAAASAEEYRTLKKGSRGEDVLNLKKRMLELGYFTSSRLSDQYNDTMAERVEALQKQNGLKADGIATPALQELIYSEKCIPKDGEAAQPEAETAGPAGVFTMPDPAGKGAPKPDEDGFLDADEPYIYASRKEGKWTYLSRDIHIEIRQEKIKSGPHILLIAAIRYRDPAWFGAMVNESTPENPTNSGTFLSKPTTVVKNHRAVFAVSDDFFGYRLLNKQKVGIVIRNKRIWSEKTRPGNGKVWPPLDILAQFEDGSWKTFESDAHTAQEYLDMGVLSTYAFGPILVENGHVSEDLKKWRTTDRAPRMALGVAADGTLIAIDALGRRKDAVGLTTTQLAEKLVEIGAVEALNLDGGNTTCMIFMDDVINRPEGVKEKDLRTINGMIGIREGADE